MKVLKTLKIALVLTVLVIATSCNQEEVNPVTGDSQKEIVVVND